MKELFTVTTEYAVLTIEWIAMLVILAGTVEAFIRAFAVMLSSSSSHLDRSVWLRFSRWLVAGLTFQLAADIIETSAAPTWDDIGRLAAIALIRTFLNYFIERDIEESRKRQQEVAIA